MSFINKYYKIGGCFLLFFSLFLVMYLFNRNSSYKELTGVIVGIDKKIMSIKDDKDITYTFNSLEGEYNLGDNVLITYSGLLDKNRKIQNVKLIECIALPVSEDYESFSLNRNSDIFGKYYKYAEEYVKKMSLDEKIGQLLLVRYSNNYKNIINNYHVGGFVFFENDFRSKSESEVRNMINDTQKISKTPLLISVDEEGGDVVRVSSNPKLRSSKFKSSSELYNTGGFDLIKSDVVEKSNLLSKLGINVNLAPVVDVSTNSSDYIYNRTLKQNTELTSKYAEEVITASKNGDVSYVLKHFPGYGNNTDTHLGTSVDSRTLDDISENDIPPFEAGIEAGAEAVLVSHNIVNSIDSNNPASLSIDVHNILRNELSFSGVVITDDLSMGATSSIPNAASRAVLAGNDIIMVTNYSEAYDDIKEAVNSGDISTNMLDQAVTRNIAWKYYKGLMFDTK